MRWCSWRERAARSAFASAATRRVFERLGALSYPLQSEEEREAVSLLDCHQPRNQQFIRMCSWCQRVFANTRWLPVEAAVVALDLMSGPTVPAITHGICEDCNSKVLAKLSALRLVS